MGEITRIGDIRRRVDGTGLEVPRPSRHEAGRGYSRPEPLWRELLGAQIRRRRRELARTLTDLAEAAGMSPQYLSEVERGRKEPSSEMIAAIAGALDTTLMELAGQVSIELRAVAPRTTATAPATSRPAGDGRVSLALVG